MTKKKDSLIFTYISTMKKSNDVETIMLDEIIRKFQSGKRYLYVNEFLKAKIEKKL